MCVAWRCGRDNNKVVVKFTASVTEVVVWYCGAGLVNGCDCGGEWWFCRSMVELGLTHGGGWWKEHDHAGRCTVEGGLQV